MYVKRALYLSLISIFFRTVLAVDLSIPLTHPYYERALITLSCHDCDYIPKVEDAGKIFTQDGKNYQLMHNGIKIYQDCYYGSWMTDIIKNLHGHHEPQEEKAFYEVLKTIPAGAIMLELGCYWAYYSMWFQKSIPGAQNYMVEPMTYAIKVGQKNFALNHMRGTFINAYIGGESKIFPNGVPQTTVDTIIEKYQIPFLYIVHSDIQGEEYQMLLECEKALEQGKIGYFFVSTHGNKIHQDCRDFLIEHQFRIIADHTPQESFSVDGLLVARSINLAGIDAIEVSKFNHTHSAGGAPQIN